MSVATAQGVEARTGRPRRRWLIPTIGVAASLFLATGGVVTYLLWPVGDITVTGRLEIAGYGDVDTSGSSCRGAKGYDDIHEGTQVIVTDASGSTVALGRLGPGASDGPYDCTFPFSLTVPAGKGIYGIEVAHRGKVQYSEADLVEPVGLQIG